NRPLDAVDEVAPAGSGFLAELCQAWEAAAQPARQAGIRVAHLRLGLVLARAGGALAPQLLPFSLGLGGALGSGRQAVSWIALDDVLGAVEHVLFTPGVAGAVNVVAPAPVEQREFARALGRVLHRPAVLPLPGTALRLALGEMGQALLLEGARVIPARLQRSGFTFQYPELLPALRWELGLPEQD
ncbi:MAG TPA: DUF1731 domain-containing protein, partial [bacterium]|nr:DUF1731 domain-containing protein [bacterium]